MSSSETVFPLAEKPVIPIVGSDKSYPVNRIFCVGRNYEAHAIEMGVAVDREAPFYFTKAPQHLEHTGAVMAYPPQTDNFHYEMEFVFVIGKAGFNVSVDNALDYVYGYACGLDMTRRDLQLVAREKGRPWDFGKDIEQGAVISPITLAAGFAQSEADIAPKRLHLTVNGEIKQDCLLETLIWKVQEIVADLSKFYHIAPGDVVYTGTPAGVGPVKPGDVLHGEIDGLAPIDLTIGEPAK
jgi:fumarylpyruvate hydrolase